MIYCNYCEIIEIYPGILMPNMDMEIYRGTPNAVNPPFGEIYTLPIFGDFGDCLLLGLPHSMFSRAAPNTPDTRGTRLAKLKRDSDKSTPIPAGTQNRL